MELFILYWLFSSLFMCGVCDKWDWKEQPWMCFFTSFVLGWFVFPIYLGIRLSEWVMSMEGCKIGHIEPCSEEMAQGIIEALRKLRNASELEEVSNRLTEHIFEDILKSIKSNDMEEKKTKKMTKAEAFEWLKGKKVYANGKCKEVQMKLFECGVSWATNHFVYYDFGDYLLIETDGYLYHCGHEGDSYWRLHHFEEISADDILSIEIVEEENEPLDKWDEFASCVAKVQEKIEDDEVCIITKGNFLTMTK